MELEQADFPSAHPREARGLGNLGEVAPARWLVQTPDMKFSVRHVTRYEYSVPVALGAHVLRLIPQGPNVHVLSHHLQIDPVPVARVLSDDAHGNRILGLEFVGETRVFGVESAIEAETSPPLVPLDPGWPSLPWSWTSGPPLPPVDARVAEFAGQIAAQVGYAPLLFLELLNRALFERTDRRIRLDGNAQTAAETLANRVGACRDLSVLFLECSRAMGIGGRFVSGYQAAADTPDGQRHLHAWAEVELPG